MRSELEPTLYVKREDKKGFMMVCLYVDDIIYAGTNQGILDDFKDQMMREFDTIDLGLLRYFLGLKVKQESDGIFLSQESYAKELLKRFGMLRCTPINTPLNVTNKFISKDGEGVVNSTSFKSLVGGLIYLTHTRPDIAFSVSIISRFMEKPSHIHFGMAKRILRYIAGTKAYDIWYSGSRYEMVDGKLYGYTNSDFASCLDD